MQDPREVQHMHGSEDATQTQQTQAIIDSLLCNDIKHNIKHDILNGIDSTGDHLGHNIVAQGDGWKVEEQGVKRNSIGAPIQPGLNWNTRTDNASGGAFLNHLSDYLYDSEAQLEKIRKEEEARRKADMERDLSPTAVWARNLALQIEEIKDERKRRLLKIKVTQVVTEFQLEDLQSEES